MNKYNKYKRSGLIKKLDKYNKCKRSRTNNVNYKI